MTSFGWGLLFGGFSFAFIMALHKAGHPGWVVAAAAVACGFLMSIIPDRWIRRK